MSFSWLPAALVSHTLDLYEEVGRSWLEALPGRIRLYSERWGLTVLPPFANLSYNFVAPARRADGSEVVLKMGVPGPELRREILALETYRGRGMVRLLAAEPEQCVFLLERIRPGNPLSEMADDDAATRIAAELMKQMWQQLPPDHPFRPVEEWMRGLARLREAFAGGVGPFPEWLVETAERLFAELTASAPPPVLLHGDLHQDNILASQRNPWLALDPKGMAGEPAYEVGALLHNPRSRIIAAPDLPALLARRIAILEEVLGIDRQRLAAHGFAQAVLSGWWSYEDHGRGWEPVMRCAEALAPLI